MKFHLPTQTHRGDSFGVLFGWLDSWMCRAHSSAPLHLASQFAKGHLNESAKLKRPSCSLGAVHLHLDPSGQCLHELIASTIGRGPQCPDDVLFSKWKSHSYVIKKIETDKLSILPSFFVHDEVKKHPTTFICSLLATVTAPMTRVKTITDFLTYYPIVIHCVSMEFKLYESLNRWIHAKVWEWIVVLVPIGHMGVPKRDTNIASPYKAIKCERNMFWMSCIWINWFALLFLKVWWSKHSKLVTLFGTVVIFSASLWIGFCELASQKPKKSHLERSSTAVWCNTGAAPGHLNLRGWGLYMKFRD